MATGANSRRKLPSAAVLLDDLIEKVVEKLVRVLVHDPAEVLIPLAKLVD